MAEASFVLGRFATTDGSASVFVVTGDRVTALDVVTGMRSDTIDELLPEWDRWFDRIQEGVERRDGGSLPATAMASLRVLPPITRPGRVLAAAANYRDHVAGMRQNFRSALPPVDDARPLPTLQPYLFAKVCPVSGAADDIVLPPGMERIDWEAELGVVIGRPGSNIPKERVGDHIAGYVVANDVSCRDRTWREDRPALRSDWLTGKSYDSFLPVGPFFAPRQFVPDHAALGIRLWVNGVLKQDGRSADMIFSIEDQIAFASEMMRLAPGDLFLTGTPAGTGQERGEFLQVGDVVETEIDGMGRQRNTVVAGSATYST